MQEAREAEAKPDSFATSFQELSQWKYVKSVLADFSALKARMHVPLLHSDITVLSQMHSEVTPIRGCLDEAWKEAKNELECMRIQVDELHKQLGALPNAQQSEEVPTPPEVQVYHEELKRKQRPDFGEKAAKRACLPRPKLPKDVLVRVLGHLSVLNIGNSRLVCHQWRRAVEKGKSELWEMRCTALGFLPEEGTDTVPDRDASRTRARINFLGKDASRKDVTGDVANVYRRHCFTWARHICRNCQPSYLSSLRACCTKPCKFRWVNLDSCIDFLSSHRYPFSSVKKFALDAQCYLSLIDERAHDSVVPSQRDSGELDVYEDEDLLELRGDIFVSWHLLKEFCVLKLVDLLEKAQSLDEEPTRRYEFSQKPFREITGTIRCSAEVGLTDFEPIRECMKVLSAGAALELRRICKDILTNCIEISKKYLLLLDRIMGYDNKYRNLRPFLFQ